MSNKLNPMEGKSSNKSHKFKRYFHESVPDNDEVEKCTRKMKKPQNLIGEVIKINDKQAKHFSNKYKRKQNPALGLKKPKLPKEILEKHNRGERVNIEGIKTKFFKEKQQRREVYLEYANEQSARTELLLSEQQGFIQPNVGEVTADYYQHEIAENVDIQSASKFFKLNLDFGPYAMRYSKNGRHLLLGGRRGHVAAFDWVTKKLHCEMNVMEEVADVTYLHMHNMFACAQKSRVFVYDNQGTELHCIKRMYRVNRLEFLPYHFLLASGNQDGYLSWLDVSIGELVGMFNSKLGEIRIMRQNPVNGVLCIGGGKGVVSMWSPKVRQPLATMLCHATPMTALTVNHSGHHLITAGLDRQVKVWDIRALEGPLAKYHIRLPANQIEISQRGVLAISQGNLCEIYSQLIMQEKTSFPYLKQQCDSFINSMRFCPYEDVLGVATANGFQSLLVPGSGEPNYDALEDNPYETRKQRREREVHSLLEKIPPEMITLDPQEIANVDVPTLQEKLDAKKALFFIKPPQISVEPKHKMKGKGGSAKAARNKQIIKEVKRKEFIKNIREAKQGIISSHQYQSEDENFIPLGSESGKKPYHVLDRFKPKTK